MEKCICICICILMTMQACGGKNNKVVNAVNDNEKETNYYGEVIENNFIVESAKEEAAEAEEKKTVIGGLVDKGVNAYSWAVNKVSGYVPEQVQVVWNKMPTGVKIAVVLFLFNLIQTGINKFRSRQTAPVVPPAIPEKKEEKKEYESIITGTNDGSKDDFLNERVIDYLDNVYEEPEVENQEQQLICVKAKDGLPMNHRQHHFNKIPVFNQYNPEEVEIERAAKQHYNRTKKDWVINIKTDASKRNFRYGDIYRQVRGLNQNLDDHHYGGVIDPDFFPNKQGTEESYRYGIINSSSSSDEDIDNFDNPPIDPPVIENDQTVNI